MFVITCYYYQDKVEFASKIKDTPPSLFSHNLMTRAVENVHAQQPNSKGVLGRIMDAAVLERLALLWDSTEVVFDTLLQKSEHIEKFLEFAREPQLLVRFRQRLAEYKQFWVDVQSVSRATLQESPRNAPPVTF